MDYEKLHKDTIAKLQEMVNSGKITVKTACGICADFVPESEDERIRKALIEMVHDTTGDSLWVDYNVHKEDALAWLEKHGGEKNLTLPKWKYKKDHTPLLRDSIILNKYGCVAKSPSGALVSGVWVIDYDELAKLPKEEIEKQDEQKPADKVEPKIKVKYAGCEYDVLEVKDTAGVTYYGIEDEPNHIDYVKADNCEIISGGYGIKENGSPYPTKHAVFSEQKPAWSDKDDKMFNSALWHVKNSCGNGGKNSGEFEVYYWLKSLKERYTWKPSDEQMNALNYVVNLMASSERPTENDLYYNILKSLRQQLMKLKG